MTDNISVIGIVASDPRVITTGEGLAITSFRLASNQGHYDRSTNKWVPEDSNFYSVSTFRQLATNSAVSVKKGQRLIVTGKLRIRPWSTGNKSGVNVDIDAEAVGHDLGWGTASFSRSIGAAPAEAFAPSSPDFPLDSEASALTGSAASADALITVGSFGADVDASGESSATEDLAATPF